MWGQTGNDTSNSFMNETVNNDGETKKSKGPKRLQNIVPVCVRQIRDHPGDEFTLFGLQTQILTLIGILRNQEIQSTKATYTIEDHTGSIKAIWWLDTDNDTMPNLPSVKENSYVQVFGSLRDQNGEKAVMVLRMIPVDNVDIVTSHLLQVVHCRLQAEHSGKNVQAYKVPANNPGTELASSMTFMDENTAANGQMGLNPIQLKVFNTLQMVNSGHASGVPRSVVLKNFPANQHKEVNNALEFLMNEGHVYSTIDNDHFKATD